MKSIKKGLGVGPLALAAALLAAPPVIDGLGGLDTGATVHAKNGDGGDHGGGNDGGHGGDHGGGNGGGHGGDHGGGNGGGNGGDHGGGNGGGNGGGHGGGNGGGHGGGNSGGHGGGSSRDHAGGYEGGRSLGKGPVASSTDRIGTDRVREERSYGRHRDHDRTEGRSLGNNHGAVASALGGLNAAHASANARLHADPNSRVGLIAQYEEAVIEGRELSEKLDRVERALDELHDQQALADEDPELIEAEIREIEDLLTDLDPETDEAERLAAELGELEERLDAVNDAIAREDEIDDAIERLERKQDWLEDNVDEAARVEAEALAAAANKDLNDEVVAELDALLGIPSEEWHEHEHEHH